MNKNNLRKHYRYLCEQVLPQERQKAMQLAVEHLLQQTIFKQSENIACYLSYKHEFATENILEAIWQAKKHCYVPVVRPERQLQFVKYSAGDVLQKNNYSIFEPLKQEAVLSAKQLDLVLLPLLAFDLQGNRLGQGGGYYDTTFAFKLGTSNQTKPFLLGVGFDLQRVDELPVESWDVRLDGILTERGIYINKS